MDVMKSVQARRIILGRKEGRKEEEADYVLIRSSGLFTEAACFVSACRFHLRNY
jgi:hypothetical protein